MTFYPYKAHFLHQNVNHKHNLVLQLPRSLEALLDGGNVLETISPSESEAPQT